MSTSERLCVVMPVYNECEAIGPVLEKWTAALGALGMDYVIRPYNDGSKDNSLAVMREVAERLNSASARAGKPGRIEVRDKPNGGHGHTILTGYRDAAADGFDWVFQIDSDDEMGPEKFGELWAARGGYDFLVGIRDGRVQALPRKIISFVSRLCVRLFYGKSVWDVNTPYRLMRVNGVDGRVGFGELFAMIPPRTFAPNVILSGLAAWKSMRLFELRVPQHDRTTGEVSIKKWKLLKAAAKSFLQTILFSFANCRRWIPLVPVLLALAALLAAQSSYFFFPGQDDQVYQLAGKIQADGGRLYRDFFDHKGPIFLGLNWFGYALCPGGWGIAAVEYVVYALAMALLYFGIVRRFGANAAFWFCAGLLLIPAWPNRPETFAMEMSVAGLGVLLLGGWRAWSWALCGVLGALVFFSKQTSVGFFVGVGVFALIQFFRQHRAPLLAYVGGGLLAMAVIVGALFAKGTFGDYWECCFRFNSIYGGNFRQFLALRFFGFAEGLSVGLVLATAAIGFGWGKAKELGMAVPLVVAWSAFFLWDFALLVLGQGPWGYQFAVSQAALYLPVLLLLAANPPCKAARCVVLVALLAAFLPRLQTISENVWHKIAHGARKPSFGITEANYDKIVSRIAELPEGGLFVWGSKCDVYARTGRKNPLAPYYYYVPFNAPGFLSQPFLDGVAAKLTGKPCIILDAMDGELALDCRGGYYANDPFRKYLYPVIDEHYKKLPLEGLQWKLYVPKDWEP